MDLNNIKRLYFIGIGGIGMSALARFFLSRGVEIFGYDLTKTHLTKTLEMQGMKIHYKEDISVIPSGIDMVIYTPAIPKSHKELLYFQENEFLVKKRAEVLGLISNEMKSIAIAGTHGKTSTSSILSHILTYCELDVTAFIGGIIKSENTNFINGKSDYVILEADEYDRSFLHLHPKYLIITSLDADHLDIYGDIEEMWRTYELLTHQVETGGSIFLMCNVENCFSKEWHDQMLEKNITIIQFGEDFSFNNLSVVDAQFEFEFRNKKGVMKRFISRLPGHHNCLNSAAAIEVSLNLGCEIEKVYEALKNFQGIKRRFEWIVDEDVVLIDDYAHHPTEIRYATNTVKQLYPDRNVLGVFQPHLYSRTQDFYREFAKALEGLDEIWLLEIYPAREQPIDGVQSALIYNLIRNNNKKLIRSIDLVDELRKRKNNDVLITLGASDIDKYHKEMITILRKN